MLSGRPVMSMYSYAWVAYIMMGWLVTVALAFVGYLLVLQIKEMRRNHNMDDQRERLGLRRVCNSFTSWLF
jgi:hypothetical protein